MKIKANSPASGKDGLDKQNTNKKVSSSMYIVVMLPSRHSPPIKGLKFPTTRTVSRQAFAVPP